MLNELNEHLDEGTKLSIAVVEPEKVFKICKSIQALQYRHIDDTLEEFMMLK